VLTLVTGVPGAGKTLNVIKEVYERYQAEWHGRNVYYFNIAELKVPAWHELTVDQVQRWFELPKGSVIIVDEAQALFPSRDFKKEVPAHVHSLSTHRHGGFDIYLITQHPMLLDASARRMVGRHIHFDRRFGSKRVIRFTWQRVCDDPLDYHQKQEAVKDAIRLDKRMFELYKSAEIHTHKFRVPGKVAIAVGFLIAIPILMYVGISNLRLPAGAEVAGSAGELGALGGGVSSGGRGGLPAAMSWEPRVAGIPSTAPIYDALTKPVTFPRLQCVSWSPGGMSEARALVESGRVQCQCYTQQATRVDTPHDLCMAIVKRGYFDHTIPDRDSGSRGVRDSSPSRASLGD